MTSSNARFELSGSYWLHSALQYIWMKKTRSYHGPLTLHRVRALWFHQTGSHIIFHSVQQTRHHCSQIHPCCSRAPLSYKNTGKWKIVSKIRLICTTFDYKNVHLLFHPSKPPTQTPKWKTLQKMILSHFHNIIKLLPQLTDNEMLKLALGESSRVVPYIIHSRKAVKAYLKASCQSEYEKTDRR